MGEKKWPEHNRVVVEKRNRREKEINRKKRRERKKIEMRKEGERKDKRKPDQVHGV